jgi:hypothetical protein
VVVAEKRKVTVTAGNQTLAVQSELRYSRVYVHCMCIKSLKQFSHYLYVLYRHHKDKNLSQGFSFLRCFII